MQIASLDFRGLLKDILARGATVRFSARGGSMTPTVVHNEVVHVAPLHNRPPCLGEVVLVDSLREGLLIHRIVEINAAEMRYITKGDASACADKEVGRSEILGRVICVERPVGMPRPLGEPPPTVKTRAAN